jgi:glycosyltransferase involved in cell wall biosynthesis
LRTLIDVVPYGCPADPIVAPAQPVLKGAHPGIDSDDIVMLWSGGTWEWFDPLTVVEAFAQANAIDPRLKLYFMGLELSGADAAPMPVVHQVRERAAQLGLAGSSILFGDWVPYDERGAYLLEADAAIIATKPVAEVRLAFRSRMLDHAWAGLPTITTGGDVLSDEFVSAGAAVAVAPGDVGAMRDCMLRFVREPEFVKRMANASRELAAERTWDKSIVALQGIMEKPWRWRELRAERPRTVHLTEDVQRLLQLRSASWYLTRIGFHARGPFMDRLKRTGFYPMMRKFRRTRLGLRIWGPVLGP